MRAPRSRPDLERAAAFLASQQLDSLESPPVLRNYFIRYHAQEREALARRPGSPRPAHDLASDRDRFEDEASASMPAPASVTKPPSTPPDHAVTAQTPCWECQRRHWECDAARPVCNRCRDAGIVCPGYNDCKPLTWLAPGRVSARPRRQRGSKARVLTAAPTIRIKSEQPADADADAAIPVPVFVPVSVSTPAKPAPRPRAGYHAKPGSVSSKAQNQDDAGEDRGRAIILRSQHQQPVARIPRLLRDPLAEMHEATSYCTYLQRRIQSCDPSPPALLTEARQLSNIPIPCPTSARSQPLRRPHRRHRHLAHFHAPCSHLFGPWPPYSPAQCREWPRHKTYQSPSHAWSHVWSHAWSDHRRGGQALAAHT